MSKHRPAGRASAGLPLEGTPMLRDFPGVPESCLDLVNEYGTYDIQPTCGIANLFPAIAQGLPRPRDPDLPEEFDDLPAPN